MGLRATFAAAAAQAFDAFDDVPVLATLNKITSTHDPLTATTSKTPSASAIAKCALVRFNEEEIGATFPQGNRPIENSDTKAIFQTSELAVGVIPNLDDTFTADGKTWKIEGVKKDPADVIWILQLSVH